MKRFTFQILLVASFALIVTSRAAATGFTVGNLVVVRVGNGATPLANNGNAVFLDEYSPAGAFVQSIALPVATSGAHRPLVLDGTAVSEGALSRSTDGRYITLTGYGTAPGGGASLSTTAAAAVNRVIARIDGAGIVNTTTALTDYADGASARSAASIDGTAFWLVGSAGGVRHATFGSATSTQISSTVTDLRTSELCVGQLYVSSASGSLRIGTVGTGFPTTGGQTITNLPGFPTTGSPHGFFLLDLDAGVAGADTLYVADDGGSIQKYSLVAGVWTSNGSIAAAGVRGLAAAVGGGTVTLYATTGTTLYRFPDSTGYNGAVSGSATTIASAAANTALRGVAIVPVAAPAITTHPATQTVNVGDTVTFTVAASGSEALTYRWRRGGVDLTDTAGSISGATTAVLTLTGVTAAAAGNYDVVVTNPVNPLASNPAVLTVNPLAASVTLGSLAQVYDGTPRIVTASTTPPGLPVTITYNGSTTAPTNAGSYTVVATISDGVHTGSTTGTLIVGKAPALVTLTGLIQSYTGTPLGAIATTSPAGLAVTLTYNGSATLPVATGTYAVLAVISDANFAGTTFGTLAITKPAAAISLGNLNQVYTGAPRVVTVSTSPSVANVTLNYGGSLTPPVNAGVYPIFVTVEDPLFSGSAMGTLVVNRATQSVTFGALPATPLVGTAFTIGASATSGLPVSFSIVSGNASLSGSSLTLNDTSPVVIRATQDGGTNYIAASAETTVTTAKQNQTISFSSPPNMTSFSTPFALSATASSALPVSFELVSGPATLSGNTVTLTGLAGTVVIRATQAGNASFEAAAPVERSFAVTRPGNAGTYFGTLGNGGPFGLIIGGDNTGAFLGFTPGTRTGYVSRTVSIDAAGRYRFVASTIASSPGTTTNVAAGTPPIAAAVDDLVVEGTIAADGIVTGTSTTGAPFSLRGSRSPDNGATVANAGFYQAGAVNSSEQILAIVGSDRQALVLVESGGVVDGGIGSVDTNGRLDISTAARQAVTGTISAETSAFNATVAPFGGGAGTSFSGFGASSTARGLQRVANLSTRTTAATGDQVAIIGFVLAGTDSKTVLIRAIGPALRDFGVTTALAAPRLDLMRSGNSVAIASNTGWSSAANSAEITSAATRSGAFALTAGSADSVVLTTLAPGAYTAVVSASDGRAGVTLVEVYDVSTAGGAQRLANVSTRATSGTGDNTLIAGVVIGGTAPKRVLIRGAGPSLTQFGVTGALVRPQLTLFSGTTVIATNAGWSTSVDSAAIAEATLRTGAFSFAPASADAAILLNLAPGAYTAQVTGVVGATGISLIEVYEVP